MKAKVIGFLLTFFCYNSFSQNWALDKSNFHMRFVATHLLVLEVDGEFQDYQVSLILPTKNFKDAAMEVKVGIPKIFTYNQMRDNRLKRPDALYVEKFPFMNFKGNTIVVNGLNKYTLTGILTLKGKSKQVSFDIAIRSNSDSRISLDFTGSIFLSEFDIRGFPTGTVGNEIKLNARG